MLPKKYFDFIFILIMGFGMSLLMTLIITYMNTGMDKDYINRFLKSMGGQFTYSYNCSIKYLVHRLRNW